MAHDTFDLFLVYQKADGQIQKDTLFACMSSYFCSRDLFTVLNNNGKITTEGARLVVHNILMGKLGSTIFRFHLNVMVQRIVSNSRNYN